MSARPPSAARHGARPAASRRLPVALRVAHGHLRLLASIALGIGVFLAAGGFRTSTRVLLGWDVGVSLYLALATVMIARFDLTLVRRRAALQDEGGPWLLILTVAAAVASLVAIVAELGAVHGTADPRHHLHLGLAVGTTALSWTFIHVIFALHYAHEFYGGGEPGRGLGFPGDGQPDYWDFVYFAFVIGMTFQVSDVQVTSKVLRRLVVAHGVVAFAFNVAILALVVNLGAGFI